MQNNDAGIILYTKCDRVDSYVRVKSPHVALYRYGFWTLFSSDMFCLPLFFCFPSHLYLLIHLILFLGHSL